MGFPDFCIDCGTVLNVSTDSEVTCDCCGMVSKSMVRPLFSLCIFVNWHKATAKEPHISSTNKFPSTLRTKLLSKTQIVTTNDTESTRTVQRDCPECSGNKMTWSEAQLRSADEGTTIFYRCVECGHR